MIGTEEKKKEIFKNLHKLRRSADNITITDDLTVQQTEELHELIKEAKNKEECDQSGRFIYRVRGPPWGMVYEENCKILWGRNSIRKEIEELKWRKN